VFCCSEGLQRKARPSDQIQRQEGDALITDLYAVGAFFRVLAAGPLEAAQRLVPIKDILRLARSSLHCDPYRRAERLEVRDIVEQEAADRRRADFGE